jgi:hypothetical protein
MGRFFMMCFESRLIPFAAPISISKSGNDCFSRLENA